MHPYTHSRPLRLNVCAKRERQAKHALIRREHLEERHPHMQAGLDHVCTAHGVPSRGLSPWSPQSPRTRSSVAGPANGITTPDTPPHKPNQHFDQHRRASRAPPGSRGLSDNGASPAKLILAWGCRVSVGGSGE